MQARQRCVSGLVLLALVASSGCSARTSKPDTAPAPEASSAESASSSPGTLPLPPPSADELPTSTQDLLQGLLDDAVESNGGVGLTASVVTPEGSWVGSSGPDGLGRSLRPEAAQPIGSITKTFVAAEVVRLAGEGSVDLDANAEDYVDLPFEGGGATVRQLLGMKSGYPTDPIAEVIRWVNRRGPERHWTARDYLALVAPSELRQGEKGGNDRYNNLNFIVLGLLVEQVTDRPLAEALRRDLIEPAGLERLWLQDAERPREPLGRAGPSDEADSPEVATEGPFLPSRAFASIVGPAGGMAADAATLSRWVYLLYGGHVVDPAFVTEMTQPEGPNDWYGLGTEIGRRYDEPYAGHGGDIGVAHATAFLWPEQQVAVAVLIPQAAGPSLTNALETTNQLADAIIDPDRLGG